VGNFLIKRIAQVYPKYNVIDEEAGVIDKKSKYTWVIDPIDGTSNFARGVPLYGIMIGLLDGDMPVAGGIALPAFSEICVAEKGKGAWCNSKRLTVNNESNLLSTLIAYGIDSHREDPDFTKAEVRANSPSR
jgi:myo-inositol-1(or 4)-monophosphatase